LPREWADDKTGRAKNLVIPTVFVKFG